MLTEQAAHPEFNQSIRPNGRKWFKVTDPDGHSYLTRNQGAFHARRNVAEFVEGMLLYRHLNPEARQMHLGLPHVALLGYGVEVASEREISIANRALDMQHDFVPYFLPEGHDDIVEFRQDVPL